MEIPKLILEQLNQEEYSKSIEFNSLEFGDIIIAKRYETDEERSKITKGHEIGPFIVVKVSNNIVYGFYGTSKEKSLYRNDSNMISLNIGYNLTNSNKEIKTTYFDISKTYMINESMFIEKTGQLSKKDLLEIKELISKYDDKSIEVCDVIIYDKNTYIVSGIEDDFLKLNLIEKCKGYSQIKINNNYYSLCNNQIQIKKNRKVTILGKVSSDIITNRNKNLIKPGIIIEYYNNLYYVYNTDNTGFTCVYVNYASEKRALKHSEYDYALVNNKYYRLYWPMIINISYNDNYKIVRMSDNNIINLKDLKKNYKKKKNKKSSPGRKWVVENKLTHELFIVTRVEEDNYYLIPFYDFIRCDEIKVVVDNVNNYEAKYKVDDKVASSFKKTLRKS